MTKKTDSSVKKVTSKRVKKPKKKTSVKYDSRLHPELIYMLRKDGLKVDEVAEKIGISKRLLEKWMKEKEEIVRKLSNLKDSERNKGGAVSKYNPDFHPTHVKYLKTIGMSNIEAATDMDISKDTFYRWIKEYPEFAKAIEEGKDPRRCLRLTGLVG